MALCAACICCGPASAQNASAAGSGRVSTFEEEAAYRFPSDADKLEELQLAAPEACRDRCLGDARCSAWTFVQPTGSCLTMARVHSRETRDAPKPADLIQFKWYAGRIDAAAPPMPAQTSAATDAACERILGRSINASGRVDAFDTETLEDALYYFRDRATGCRMYYYDEADNHGCDVGKSIALSGTIKRDGRNEYEIVPGPRARVTCR
jgi:hypothetical protein